MASAIDVIRSVNPPRSVFLDFPLGHTTGKPHEPELQRGILVKALEAVTLMEAPGSVARLDFRWSETDDWKKAVVLKRAPRYDTPQYQTEEDRIRAESLNRPV